MNAACLPTRYGVFTWTLAWLTVWSAWAAEPQRPISERLEKFPLFKPQETGEWTSAECTIVASTDQIKVAPESLHWHVSVDHTTGEKLYPIGWPRFGRALTGPLQDWSEWDYLHGWILADTSRNSLPREPAGLGIRGEDGQTDFNLPLSDLKKGEWVELLVPVAQLSKPSGLQRLQFHISESNYRHGDQVDFYINDLALVRYSEPTLIDFEAEQTLLFADARVLAARFQLVGVKGDERREVTCGLWRGDVSITQTVVLATRGRQRVPLDLRGSNVEPGEYELRAVVAGNDKSTSTRVRLVESPWKD